MARSTCANRTVRSTPCRMAGLAIACSIIGCNAPAPTPPSGGVTLPEGPCGRGLVVVSSDYQSTNVSLLDVDGRLASASLISSASESSALSSPLSGDVTLPTTLPPGPDVVLLDRYPASVLTWINVETGEVRAQLDVSTGFAANPRDYLALDDGRAYVSRFESNPLPGAEAYDAGGDLLIIDPVGPSILDRIDLTPAMGDDRFLPRPSRMTRFDGAVYVLMLGYTADFSDAAPSRLVRVDPQSDQIENVIVLAGFYGCEGLVTRGTTLGVTCSGRLSGGETWSPEGAGLLTLPAGSSEFASVRADDLLAQPLGFTLAFTQTGTLVTALGAFGSNGQPDTRDALLHVGPGGTFSTILESTSRPFELGELLCTGDATRSCSRCFLTDGEAGALHRLNATDGRLESTTPLNDGIGLPPRSVRGF